VLLALFLKHITHALFFVFRVAVKPSPQQQRSLHGVTFTSTEKETSTAHLHLNSEDLPFSPHFGCVQNVMKRRRKLIKKA